MSPASYDSSETYRWNYEHAPAEPTPTEVPTPAGAWTFCGRPVSSPLGVAAGPLLNGRWILHYAALGFDVLTYKTVRSHSRECYPLPNLVPVECDKLTTAGRDLVAAADMRGSWAVSFGMPSMPPDVWQADIEWTRKRLPPGKLLSVSVVATPEPHWSVHELARDFAICARWAVASGADCIETNFSCPNVSSADGQLYQQPAAAATVAQHVREAIGRTPYLIKIGFLESESLAEQLLDAVAPHADALAMTNCISASVWQERQPLFDGQLRGIGGRAIRDASIGQVRPFARLVRERGYAMRIIGVGGIFSASDVREYLEAGAESVQLATAIMVDPLVGVRIRREMATDSTAAHCRAAIQVRS